MMKRTLLILGAMLALLSCTKVADREPEFVPRPVSFDVAVEAPGTKAASKTAWADGDVIYIVFKGVTDKYLCLTYNGGTSSWSSSASSAFDEADFTALGGDLKLTAVHFPVAVAPSLKAGVLGFADGADAPVYTYYLKQEDAAYTVDGTTVTVRLSLAIAGSYAQFHIPGIGAGVAAYTLKANGVRPVACTGITASTGAVTEAPGAEGGAFGGFADADGGVFSARIADPGVDHDYVFILNGPDDAYVFTKSRSLAGGVFYKFKALDDASWSKPEGKFSVSSTLKVRFSQGNLQYVGSAGTPYWKFADNQWDVLGTTTGQNSASMTVDRDLFGWGTGAAPSIVSNDNGDYDSFTDWGHNAIINGGNAADQWRTLTKEEWQFIFGSSRPGTRFAKATVNDVKGVILLPDGWNTSYYTLVSTNSEYAAYDSNSIDAATWISKLESHGAVFLPAAGARSLTTITSANSGYWSATPHISVATNAYLLILGTELNAGWDQPRSAGYSVRLVKNL